MGRFDWYDQKPEGETDALSTYGTVVCKLCGQTVRVFFGLVTTHKGPEGNCPGSLMPAEEVRR